MAIQYNIYWDYFPGVTTADNQILNVTSPYDHTGLTPGVTIYYVATAYDTDTALESAISNELSATPIGPPNSMGQAIW